MPKAAAITQGEFVRRVSEITEITQADVKRVLEAAGTVVVEAVGSSKVAGKEPVRVTVPGLAKFTGKMSAPRRARMMTTPQGEQRKIPAQRARWTVRAAPVPTIKKQAK